MRTDYSMSDSQNPRRRGGVEIMMTPMIDVVFLLLVFFLTTSSFEMVEKMLPGGVSEKADSASGSDSLQPPPDEPLSDVSDLIVRVVKSVDGNTQLELNGEALKDAIELKSRLQSIIQVRADVPVIVDPDAQVPIGEAILAYDAARAAGAIRVFLTSEG